MRWYKKNLTSRWAYSDKWRRSGWLHLFGVFILQLTSITSSHLDLVTHIYALAVNTRLLSSVWCLFDRIFSLLLSEPWPCLSLGVCVKIYSKSIQQKMVTMEGGSSSTTRKYTKYSPTHFFAQNILVYWMSQPHNGPANTCKWMSRHWFVIEFVTPYLTKVYICVCVDHIYVLSFWSLVLFLCFSNDQSFERYGYFIVFTCLGLVPNKSICGVVELRPTNLLLRL